MDTFLPPEVRADMPLEEQLKILLDRLDMAQAARPREYFNSHIPLIFELFIVYSSFKILKLSYVLISDLTGK